MGQNSLMNSDNSSSTGLRILNLEQACLLSQEPKDSLLREGELGALTFFIRVPSGAEVRLYNQRTNAVGEPSLMCIPNVLALDEQAYAEFRVWNGQAHVSLCPRGGNLYMDQGRLQFELLSPQGRLPVGRLDAKDTSDADDKHYQRRPPPQWTHWRVTFQNNPVKVTPDDIFILDLDIKRRFGQNLLPSGSPTPSASSAELSKDDFKHEDYAGQLAKSIRDHSKSAIAERIAAAVLAAENPAKSTSVWIQLCSMAKSGQFMDLKFFSDVELRQPGGKTGWKPLTKRALEQLLGRFKPAAESKSAKKGR